MRQDSIDAFVAMLDDVHVLEKVNFVMKDGAVYMTVGPKVQP